MLKLWHAESFSAESTIININLHTMDDENVASDVDESSDVSEEVSTDAEGGEESAGEGADEEDEASVADVVE